jgi:protein TonB
MTAKRTPLAAASSIGLHAALLAVVAAVSVAPPLEQKPVRVVLIDAPAGGGQPRSGSSPAPGEIAGPPRPPVDVPIPPPPAVQPERIAAKPRPRAAEKPSRSAKPRAPVAKPPVPDAPTETGSGGGGTGGPDEGSGGRGGGNGTGVGNGTGPGDGVGVDEVVARYLSGVRKRLETVKRYPVLARRRGTEGTTTLAIEIGRDGRPAAVRISASSGSELLDIEAEEMVQRAAPFEPLPTAVVESTLRVVVPVSFALGDA